MSLIHVNDLFFKLQIVTKLITCLEIEFRYIYTCSMTIKMTTNEFQGLFDKAFASTSQQVTKMQGAANEQTDNFRRQLHYQFFYFYIVEYYASRYMSHV